MVANVDPGEHAPSLKVRRCRVFISYARHDERHRRRLVVHLTQLVRDGLIDLWSDWSVIAGADWDRDIRHQLEIADIVVLLVTPNFVASAYCFEKELPLALRRGEEEGVRVLPVYVKSVDLVNLPFGKIAGLPANLRPISAWRDPDEAWLQVAQCVRRMAEAVRESMSNRVDAG